MLTPCFASRSPQPTCERLAHLRRELEGHRCQPRAGCPKDMMDTPNGGLVRRCFRLLNAKSIGLTITLADITEEEFRVLELNEAERQDKINSGDGGNRNSR